MRTCVSTGEAGRERGKEGEGAGGATGSQIQEKLNPSGLWVGWDESKGLVSAVGRAVWDPG